MPKLSDLEGVPDPQVWKGQEARVAKKGGGSIVRASGAGLFSKGDVGWDTLLIEAKTTSKESLGVKKAWLKKITDEAATAGKTPALAIGFDTMPPGTPADWVAVPAEFLAALVVAVEK